MSNQTASNQKIGMSIAKVAQSLQFVKLIYQLNLPKDTHILLLYTTSAKVLASKQTLASWSTTYVIFSRIQ